MAGPSVRGAEPASSIVTFAAATAVLPPVSDINRNFLPVGETRRRSRSSGKVCDSPVSVTFTLPLKVVGKAETTMGDGKILAGAPVIAPVPVAGITIAEVFENVLFVVWIVPNIRV